MWVPSEHHRGFSSAGFTSSQGSVPYGVFFIPHEEATEQLNQSSVLQTRSDASTGRAAFLGLSAVQGLGGQLG